MALVNMGDMLGHAYRHAYAVGAFGVVTLEFLEAVIQAAENCRSPVILNQTESRFENYDFELMMPAIITAARRATVPVAVNFDHGSNLASAEKAIRSGCNGVMVDTSMMTLSENLWLTRDLVTKAHASGVSVEGVIGYVPGADGENIRYYPGKLLYTSATEAKGFIERTGVDCLSVSIGTVHGRMKGLPKLDYARLSKIKEATGIPLVIHGGSGLSDDQFRRLICNGVAKINYYTGLSDAACRRIKENISASKQNEQSTLLTGVRDAVRMEAERCLGIWGCSGRAAEVLGQCRPWQALDLAVLSAA